MQISEECLPESLSVLFLFLVSELLSLSDCSFNGVLDMLVKVAQGVVAYRAYRQQDQQQQQQQNANDDDDDDD